MTPTFLIFCGKTTETNWNDTKTAISGEEPSSNAGTRRGGYGRKAAYMEGRLMDYSGELLKRAGDEAPLIEEQERHSGMQSVQNLEAVINEGLRTALDLTAEWDALGNGSAMITGVIAARRTFVEAHPEATAEFLDQYAGSVAWVNTNTAEAASLIGELGIVEAAVAEKALPYCNIVCITGSEMEEKLSGYLAVLYNALPQSVGGVLPGHDFYYGA